MRRLLLQRVQKYTALKSRKVCSLLKGKSNMKFKARLRVTFISIILLPGIHQHHGSGVLCAVGPGEGRQQQTGR